MGVLVNNHQLMVFYNIMLAVVVVELGMPKVEQEVLVVVEMVVQVYHFLSQEQQGNPVP
jgi:hypothetical protein